LPLACKVFERFRIRIPALLFLLLWDTEGIISAVEVARAMKQLLPWFRYPLLDFSFLQKLDKR
jgi:hypothetical protein